jgi:hypothetical protein
MEATFMETKQKITVEQAAAGFDRGVEVLDEIRAMQIANGLRLQSAKGSVYAREHTRLLRKFGKDHPRTTEMASRIKANAEYKTAITREYKNASTMRPDPGSGWVVDGFVCSADGTALKGLTVAAYDRENEWYREFGYTCTNQAGYFSLVVKKLPENSLRRVVMRVSKGKIILPSTMLQLSPKAGSNDRVEIVVGEKDDAPGVCTPPDGKTTPVHTPPEQVALDKGADVKQNSDTFASTKPAKKDPPKGSEKSAARGIKKAPIKKSGK